MPPEAALPTWSPAPGPSTEGWCLLENGGRVIAQVQPFEDGAWVTVYPNEQPWRVRSGRAASIAQGKRHAERWLAAQLVFKPWR